MSAGRVVAALFYLIWLVLAAGAHAQPSEQVDPGRQEERLKPPLTPQTTPEIVVPALPPEAIGEELDKVRFTLTGVIVEGATVFSEADFLPLYQALLGKEVSLRDVFAVRDAITKKYRDAGYVLSLAIVPPQRIVGGVVHIKVVEGYINRTDIEGDIQGDGGLVRQYADRLTRSRPLTRRDLERYVFLIEDLPGVSVRTVLKPSDQPGAALLTLIVSQQAVAARATADNRGSRALGPVEFELESDLNNAFGLYDQTSADVVFTPSREIRLGTISHSQFIGSEGLRATLSYTRSETHPGGSLKPLDMDGKSWSAEGELAFPFIRSREENLLARMAFRARDSESDALGVPLFDDRTRVLSFGVTYDWSDAWLWSLGATSALAADVSKGLDILDASKTGSPDLSRANGHSDFTKVRIEAVRLQQLSHNFGLALRALGQASADPLLASEQIGVGGERFGRAFEPSELTGDHGIALSGELQFIPHWSAFLGAGNLQFYAFCDYGQVWNKDVPATAFDGGSLASAGGGLRLSFLDFLEVNGEIAKPLTRDVAAYGDRNPRVFVSLSASF